MKEIEINSSLINSDEFKFVKQSLIAASEKDGQDKFRVKTLEYINDSCENSDDMFFYDMLEFVRFLDPSDPETEGHVAYTTPDCLIYFNMPCSHIANARQWDFVHDHECLHQLWKTFGVAERIKNEGIEYDHKLLNVASDCVINQYLRDIRKKECADGLITPEYLEKTFGITYDYKHDTQFSLYVKLLNAAKEIQDAIEKLLQQFPEYNSGQDGQDGQQDQDDQPGQGSQGQGSQGQGNQGQGSQGQGSSSSQRNQQGQGSQGGQSGQGSQGQGSQGQGGQGGQSGQRSQGQGSQGQGGQGSQGGQSGQGSQGQGGQGGQQGGQSGQGEGGRNPNETASEAADRAEKAAEAAENAAKASGDPDDAAKAKEARAAADEAAKAAKDAASARSEKDKADATKKARAAADRAEDAASKAGADTDGDSTGKNGKNPGGSGRGSGESIKGIESDEDLDRIRKQASNIIEKYRQKVSGAFGDFISKCKSSFTLNKSGLKVSTEGRGTAGWARKMKTYVNGFVKKKVFQKKREFEPTYKRMNRRQGVVHPGDMIAKGKRVKKNGLTINVAFYIDRSGSMGGCIDDVFTAAYALCEGIKKQFKADKTVDDITFKMHAFDTKMVTLQYGKKIGDGGGTMSFDDILDYITLHTKDFMINVIITDADFDINTGEVKRLIKDIDGMILFITNQDNDTMKELAKQHATQLFYILADPNFTI